MDALDNSQEKIAISEIDSNVRLMAKNWVGLKKARKVWDFKSTQQLLEVLTQDIQKLNNTWETQQTVIQAGFQAEQAYVYSADYPPQLEAALQAAEIPFKGEFPNYEFPPFKLSFNLDLGTVRLALGRRSQQTRAFAPDSVAEWVAGQYRRVVESKFDADRFCKELLFAYELLNRLVMKQDHVTWEHPIPLKEIYRILTVKQSAKQDYPEAMFIFDLARLKEQMTITYNGYTFELVPTREQANSYLLTNRQGQESRVSTLNIYQTEKS